MFYTNFHGLHTRTSVLALMACHFGGLTGEVTRWVLAPSVWSVFKPTSKGMGSGDKPGHGTRLHQLALSLTPRPESVLQIQGQTSPPRK